MLLHEIKKQCFFIVIGSIGNTVRFFLWFFVTVSLGNVSALLEARKVAFRPLAGFTE